MTAADLIAFETRVRAEWEAGNLPTLLHLCGGNEEQLIEIAKDWKPDDWVFSTHRNHYHALLKGIPPERVFSEIMAGRSMFMYSREHRFFTSAILASCTGIAAGVAAELKQNLSLRAREAGEATQLKSPHVYCFLGDGAEEQGHFYEAALFAEAHDLPITFIIEDNDRQVDTDKVTRRPVVNDYTHKPLDQFRCVKRYHYTPTYPHAGSGCKHQITFSPEAVARLRTQNQDESSVALAKGDKPEAIARLKAA